MKIDKGYNIYSPQQIYKHTERANTVITYLYYLHRGIILPRETELISSPRYHIIQYNIIISYIYYSPRSFFPPSRSSFGGNRLWPSRYALALRWLLLLSSSLGEMSACSFSSCGPGKTHLGKKPLCCQENPWLFGKNLFLATFVFQENPLLFWEKPIFSPVFVGVGGHFVLLGKTHDLVGEKKTFIFLGKPVLIWEKPSFCILLGWSLSCIFPDPYKTTNILSGLARPTLVC